MSLRDELTCRYCKGTMKHEWRGAEIDCGECVDGIPRQWIETVVAVYDRWDYQTGGNRAMLLNDSAKRQMVAESLVALRDREETE